MLSVFTVRTDGREGAGVTVADRLPETVPSDAITWIDVQGIDNEVIHTLKERFKLDDYSTEDVIVGNQRQKIEDYDEYDFSVIRVPSGTHKGLSFSELFFFFSDRWIITIHREEMQAVELAKERIKARGLSFLRTKPSTDLLYYLILDLAVDAFYPALDAREEAIDKLEQRIERRIDNKGNDVQRVRNLSLSFVSIKSDLMALRRDASALRDVLGQIMRGAVPFIRNETLRNFRDIYDHSFQLIETLDAYRERVNEVRDLHISMITASTNNVVKVLTIVVTILSPLSLIAGIYGTNFTSGFFAPGTGVWYGFYTMVTAMAAIAAAMIYLFRRTGWI